MPTGATDVQMVQDPVTKTLAVQATLEFPDGSTAPFSMTIKDYQYQMLAQFIAMAPHWTFHGGAAPDATDVAHVLLAINMPFLWAGPAPTAPPQQPVDDLVLG